MSYRTYYSLKPVRLIAVAFAVGCFLLPGAESAFAQANNPTNLQTQSNPQAETKADKDSMLWRWTQRGGHHDAIVSVHSDNGFGTGVIVKIDRDKPIGDGFEGWCLTAWHVVSGDNGRRQVKVKYQDGSRARKCKIIAHDTENDVALLWVWVPDTVSAVTIADAPAKLGEDVEFAGLGGNSKLNCCIRHFIAKTSVSTNPKQLFADAPLLPGDSGGPVFNSDNQLTGIISGGWFWLNADVDSDTDKSLRITWPARAGNLGAIQKLLDHNSQLESEPALAAK